MNYEYTQKQGLNDECDRFFKIMKKFKSCGQNYKNTVTQVILINGQKQYFDDDEYLGIIQTFKKFINESVVDKINDSITYQ